MYGNTSYFDYIPDDQLLLIALDLELKEINQLCNVNERFNNIICNNNYFWQMRLKHEYPLEYDTLDISTIGDWKKTYRAYNDCLKPITEDEYYDWLIASKRNSTIMVFFRTNTSTGLYFIKVADSGARGNGKTVYLTNGVHTSTERKVGWNNWKAPLERIISELPEYNTGTFSRWILDPITAHEIYNQKTECFKYRDNYARTMVLRDYNYMLDQLSVGRESVYPLHYYLNAISQILQLNSNGVGLTSWSLRGYSDKQLEQYINNTKRDRENLINDIAIAIYLKFK
jgi:hypothetical protein